MVRYGLISTDNKGFVKIDNFIKKQIITKNLQINLQIFLIFEVQKSRYGKGKTDFRYTL